MGLFSRHSIDQKHPDEPPDPTPPSAPPPAYPASTASYPAEKPHPSPPQPELKSYLQQQQPGFGSSSIPQGSAYAALLLSRSDRIRIIGFPGSIVGPLDQAIKRVWAPGVAKQEAYDRASWEWKLNGRPWYGQGGEAVPSRRLIAHVLHALLENGWHLVMSTDLSKKGFDKDTLLFKSGPAQQRFIFPISFNESDKIRLIDPPHDGIKAAFETAIRGAWSLGIQDAKTKEPGAYQIKLKGNPWWTSDGAQINRSRMLACAILSAMDAQGFEFLQSVDMSAAVSGNEHQSELDTWFFISKT